MAIAQLCAVRSLTIVKQKNKVDDATHRMTGRPSRFHSSQAMAAACASQQKSLPHTYVGIAGLASGSVNWQSKQLVTVSFVCIRIMFEQQAEKNSPDTIHGCASKTRATTPV